MIFGKHAWKMSVTSIAACGLPLGATQKARQRKKRNEPNPQTDSL
jgi:hypothetical protein